MITRTEDRLFNARVNPFENRFLQFAIKHFHNYSHFVNYCTKILPVNPANKNLLLNSFDAIR